MSRTKTSSPQIREPLATRVLSSEYDADLLMEAETLQRFVDGLCHHDCKGEPHDRGAELIEVLRVVKLAIEHGGSEATRRALNTLNFAIEAAFQYSSNYDKLRELIEMDHRGQADLTRLLSDAVASGRKEPGSWAMIGEK
jgi:hypothetical protein